ncbi:TetR/AcrR family transcriptional regulator [Agromyces sp. SYSU K20354]|uniref:TetR/AcrR family transcriptional regulator n=1 Tax=Agromyces cavernae TaxID=2898659 RepID=UPI001E5AA0DF|nr:TetR/AcrR family transcriptional regulator [Agromyces cavernae]MCD2443238.1 TetR/AcrR family transcriptional regulator [Agromyces cavernae]
MANLTSAKPDELALAAFELFSTRGIAGVNMDAIAAGAGVTKGSLYWHYASKKEIILAACNLYYRAWRRQILEATESSDRPAEKLEAAVAFSVRSCLLDDANRVFTTEIVAMSLYDSEVRASWAGFLDETERFFLGLTHRAVGAGELRCDDVDRAVDLMLAAMEGIKQIALFRPQACLPENEQRTCRRLMSLLGERVSALA